MKSYLWSEGRCAVEHMHTPQRGCFSWFTRTYALPVFSKAAYDRCKEKGGMSHLAVWDSRNLRGQALRLVRVQTIMQMEVSPKLYGLPLPHIRLGEHHLSLGNGTFFVKI